jgi:nicotinamidase/pyrazinamidase
MAAATLQPDDALLVVDVQNDFLPGGALAVPAGNDVVPILNEWIKAAVKGGALVVASRDWHPSEHVSFLDWGGRWPRHCLQQSGGADFHPDLMLPGNVVIISKGTDAEQDAYSAFDETHLAEILKRRGVRRVWVGGLALDVCVQATVLDALKAGFETHVIPEASKPIDEMQGQRALEEMRRAGARIAED